MSGMAFSGFGKRVLRLSIPAVLIALAVVGLWSASYGLMLLPRSVRRAVVEFGLRGVLIGYAGVLVGSILGVVALLWSLEPRRRRGFRLQGWRPALLAICLANLLAIALSEAASVVWLAWEDRLPTLPTRFEPDDGRLRIVVLGGSSALGHPYAPTLSVGQVVAWQINEARTGRPVEVEILARLGASLQDNLPSLAKIRHRPSAVMVYAGHNEFAARYEEERVVSLDEDPTSGVLHALYRVSLASPLCRLVYRTASQNRLDGRPPMTNHHSLIDEPMVTPSESAEVVRLFRRQLEGVVSWSEEIGAVPILIIPPGNESDYPPNRSLLPASASAQERAWIEDRYEAARGLEERDPGGAEAIYRAMVARQPGFAEAHYRLARCLEHFGRFEEARRHDLRAIDLDGMPNRCASPLREAYREVAARHPSCVLVDGPAVLRSICPHGLLGAMAMQDGHHPSLRGTCALARAVLVGLRGRHAFGLGDDAVFSVQPVHVGRQFGMTSARWQSVCDWGRSFYRWVSGFRFDPSEHEALARRFEECERRLKEGEPVESLDFAPLSLAPLP